MNRRNEILVVALVVQLVLILLITTLRAPAASAPAKPVFDNVKAGDVQAMTVQDTAGAKLNLTNKNSNWVLSDSDDYAADNTKVTTFIGKLLKMQTGRLIAQTASSYARLQVADDAYGKRVQFKTADGKTHTLLIGSTGGGGSVYVRADGAAEVWLTDSVNDTDASTAAVDWINPTLFTVQNADVTRVDITNHNGTFDFTQSNNTWVMKGLSTGEKFDQTKLTDTLSKITSLVVTKPLGKTIKPEYGLQAPSATITLTLKQTSSSKKPIVIQVGAKNAADSTYSAITTESPYYVTVSNYNLNDFVTRSKQDFLVPPPTAVPTTTVTPAQ
jgi:hypothetical protein